MCGPYGRSWCWLHLLPLTGQGQQHAGVVSVRVPVQRLLLQRERSNRAGAFGFAWTAARALHAGLCSCSGDKARMLLKLLQASTLSMQLSAGLDPNITVQQCYSTVLHVACKYAAVLLVSCRLASWLASCPSQQQRCAIRQQTAAPCAAGVPWRQQQRSCRTSSCRS